MTIANFFICFPFPCVGVPWRSKPLVWIKNNVHKYKPNPEAEYVSEKQAIRQAFWQVDKWNIGIAQADFFTIREAEK